ncbi:MAG: hypothetical protein LBC87_11440 [Fibromonadaceae bacterium]|jgi:hypothetical protein|nr:hypothetical protein [Fibromonadaceae bacterium]
MYILALIFALLISCSGYDREEFRMEVGKKYALTKWPDSTYIDTLDRFFKYEPLKQSAKQKVEMTMSNNIMSLPQKPTQSKPRISTPNTASPPKTSEAKTQSFPDKFFYSLSKLLENPNNSEFGKKHRAKGGETLDELLVRVYGQQAKKIPKYVSESMLRQLNSGTDFSSMAEGEAVLLPVVR